MTDTRRAVPDLGVGVGLRVPHYKHVVSERPAVDFLEVISENFMVDGGKPLHYLDQVLEHYPVVLHGVSLNIGGPAPPEPDYLRRLKQLVRRVRPAWVSDHFCWTGVPGQHLHDLLPLPYTEEVVQLVAERARRVQDLLEVPFALENTSSYMSYRQSQMSEWEFCGAVCEAADVGLMFDVNNVYVSAYNHGFDAYEFIRGIPHERIVQIHLAGHTNLGPYIIDTHNGDVIEPVWDLYRATIELAGPVSTLIEWDDDIPDFPVLQALARRAAEAREQGLRARARRRHDPSLAALAERSLVPRVAQQRPSVGAWQQGGPRLFASDDPGATP